VRIAIPLPAMTVEGSNPRGWNQPISFGAWRTNVVGGTTDGAHRMVLEGPGQPTNIECRENEAGPILVCNLSRRGYHTVLQLEGSDAGTLRQVGGATYDIRSVHHAAGSSVASSETFGYEIIRDERALAVIETVNQGRVWIDPDATNRDDLAAAAAALLLWSAGAVPPLSNRAP